MTEALALSILLSLLIMLMGWRLRSLPIVFISSMGWMACSLMVYEELDSVLPMALLLFIAISQLFIIKKGA